MTAHAVGTGAGDLAESLDRGGVAGRTGVARAGVACARAGGAVTSEVRYRHRQGGDCLIEQRGNRLDVAGELVDLVQQEAGQPGVVVGEPTGAGGFQLRPAGPSSSPGQLGEDLRVTLPSDQHLDHRPARDAVHVGEHRRDLDQRVLEQLLHSLLDPGAVLD